KSKEKTILTAALPYANAQIHIGHLVEYVQADVYARFLRLINQDVLYICASDMHGTPIEVKAQEQNTTPKKFAQKYHQLNKETFKKYLINFDNYHHTDSKENQELAIQFFNTLNKKGYIYKKKIDVIYCPQCQRNLPDRYVKGTCPNCGAYDQYGDICENCNLILKGTDLLNPKCSICQTAPIKKESEHYFFKLSKFSKKLAAWLQKTPLQQEIKNSIKEWINKGLEDWCISRDGPYFGFKIPGEKNKYFYVWLDAPIGYISSTQNYCNKHKLKLNDYWKKGNIIHVIGKDIIYFHFLFWPAMLMAADFSLPKDIVVHGFLTVNGKKMSKSRGTFFTAEDFLKLYDPECLRFYYAQHLSKKLSDIDLDFEDFKATVNNKLVANLANFCYRTLSFAHKNYQGKIIKASEPEIEKATATLIKEIEQNYLDFNYKAAVANILKISDLGNVYFQKSEPWKDIPGSQAPVSFCVNLVRNLSILIKPILPEFAKKVETTINSKNLQWKDLKFNFTGKTQKPLLLIKRIEKVPEAAVFPLDLKVGKITKVEDHPNADSLYVLKVDFGKQKKQAVAGLKKYFKKEVLQNKKAVFCMNIKPAKLRGIESTTMVLAAADGKNVALLDVEGSNPGDEVTLEGYQNSKSQITFEDFKKIRMEVKNKQVIYQTKHLKTLKEDVTVRGVRDGAVIE
ncbi:methionine--tRNA ligase, partial [Candidatus Woesearchaeota archaeon]|nr:methionine--tRNA ligase [Candidatus Woesearchaeota archaeon]